MKAVRGTYELAIFGAWQTERMHREDKLRPLRHYLKQSAAPRPHSPPTAAERLARYRALERSGASVQITRLK